jgi:uncharacterized protein YjbJ (UPF0337 family)
MGSFKDFEDKVKGKGKQAKGEVEKEQGKGLKGGMTKAKGKAQEKWADIKSEK